MFLYLSKKNLQNLFLIILAITVSFNASINPLLIQVSSICFIIFFLLCLKNIQILERIKENYIDNRAFFIFFFYIYKFFNNSDNSTSIKFNRSHSNK